jgi:hypothetical protein
MVPWSVPFTESTFCGFKTVSKKKRGSSQGGFSQEWFLYCGTKIKKRKNKKKRRKKEKK